MYTSVTDLQKTGHSLLFEKCASQLQITVVSNSVQKLLSLYEGTDGQAAKLDVATGKREASADAVKPNKVTIKTHNRKILSSLCSILGKTDNHTKNGGFV